MNIPLGFTIWTPEVVVSSSLKQMKPTIDFVPDKVILSLMVKTDALTLAQKFTILLEEPSIAKHLNTTLVCIQLVGLQNYVMRLPL